MSFTLDFSQHQFKSGGAGLDDGFYTAQVTAMEQTFASSGRPQMKFTLTFPNGAVRNEWITVPQSPADKVMVIWQFAFESAGYTTDQLQQMGQISGEALPSLFVGRNVHVEYKNGNKDLGKRMVVKLVTPSMYERGLKAAAAAPAAATAAAAAPTQPRPSVVVQSPSSGFNQGASGGASALSALMNSGG